MVDINYKYGEDMIKNLSTACCLLAIASAMNINAMDTDTDDSMNSEHAVEHVIAMDINVDNDIEAEPIQIARGDFFVDVAEQDVSAVTMQLISACKANNPAQAQLCIDNGADINISIGEYKTPLIWASEKGYLEIATILLTKHDINIDIQGYNGNTALMSASEKGYLEIVILLRKYNADVNRQNQLGWHALRRAAAAGHLAIVTFLLQQPDIILNTQYNVGYSTLMSAISGGHVEVALLLILHGIDINTQNHSRYTALMLATEIGYIEIAMSLLQNPDIDVNAQSISEGTALAIAIQKHHKEIAALLLQNPNTRVNTQNYSGETPLALAVSGDDMEIATSILYHPNSDITTALMMEAKICNIQTIDFILQHPDANINMQDNTGKTILMNLGSYSYQETQHVLNYLIVQHRADVHIRDNFGMTALIHAAKNTQAYNGFISDGLLRHKSGANTRDHFGKTALMHAIISDCTVEAIKPLLIRSNIKLQDDTGKTALMYATIHSKIKIINLLLDQISIKKQNYDILINRQDDTGMTALMYVLARSNNENMHLLDPWDEFRILNGVEIQNGYCIEIIKRFVFEFNTDMTLRDKRGKTALIYCIESNIIDIELMRDIFLKNYFDHPDCF